MSVILDKLDRVVELATLPEVALEVNILLADEHLAVSEIIEVIEKDPAIVAKVLKLVNSSFYGFTGQINDLAHAAVILGNRTLHSTVISIAVCDTLPRAAGCTKFSLAHFWQHSVAVALISRELARQSGRADSQECFTAGLLHDIGKLILVEYFKDEFVQVWERKEEQGGSFIAAEQEMLDSTHAEIGHHVGESWQLPRSLLDVMAFHHNPSHEMDNSSVVAIVHVADILANVWSKDLVEAPMLKSMDEQARSLFAEQLKSLRHWFPPLVEEIEESAKFFY